MKQVNTLSAEKEMKMMEIDFLASQIAGGQLSPSEEEDVWSELFPQVKKELMGIANSFGNHYSKSMNIEKELFLEAVDMAILMSVKKYNTKKGHFVARARIYAENHCKNVLRDSQADIRQAHTISGSLNVKIGEQEEGMSHQDMVADSTVNVVASAQKEETGILALLHKYSRLSDSKKQEAELIGTYMLYANKEERKEALLLLTENKVKWDTVRQQVSRAKKNFKKYAIAEGGF